MTSPFTLDEFCSRVGAYRGTVVHRVPLATRPETPCGNWLGTAGGTDYIFHDSGTTRLHIEHIVAHEAGHMLLRHPGSSTRSEELLHKLAPELDLRTAQQIMAREGYTHPEEREAEVFAALVLEPVRRHVAPRQHQVPGATLRRVQATFG